jgi:hypothetical protein
MDLYPIPRAEDNPIELKVILLLMINKSPRRHRKHGPPLFFRNSKLAFAWDNTV